MPRESQGRDKSPWNRIEWDVVRRLLHREIFRALRSHHGHFESFLHEATWFLCSWWKCIIISFPGFKFQNTSWGVSYPASRKLVLQMQEVYHNINLQITCAQFRGESPAWCHKRCYLVNSLNTSNSAKNILVHIVHTSDDFLRKWNYWAKGSEHF